MTTMTEKPKKKRGPKKGQHYKIIDWSKVEQMIIQGCNGVQVAASIGITTDTLYLRCIEENKINFPVYFQERRAKGDSYIHQAQYQKALKEKNTTMLIHLGKHRLDQKDKDEEKDKTPPQDAIVDRDNENMSLKAQLAKLTQQLLNIQAKLDNQSKTGSELPGIDTPF